MNITISKPLMLAGLSLLVSIPVFWNIYGYYYQTVEIHVPVIGYVDTGVTKYELKQFEVAMEEYQEKEQALLREYRRNQMTAREYQDRLMKIQWESQSDPRITAVTGGPAKQVLKFLLNKI